MRELIDTIVDLMWANAVAVATFVALPVMMFVGFLVEQNGWLDTIAVFGLLVVMFVPLVWYTIGDDR